LKAFVVVFHPKKFPYENNSVKNFNLIINYEKYQLDNIKELIENVYLVSLSSEFNSFENLKKTFKNYNNITDEGIDFPSDNISIEIETTKNMDFFDFEVITFNLNFYKMMSGMFGLCYN
jgi:hypothetical protein